MKKFVFFNRKISVRAKLIINFLLCVYCPGRLLSGLFSVNKSQDITVYFPTSKSIVDPLNENVKKIFLLLPKFNGKRSIVCLKGEAGNSKHLVRINLPYFQFRIRNRKPSKAHGSSFFNEILSQRGNSRIGR